MVRLHQHHSHGPDHGHTHGAKNAWCLTLTLLLACAYTVAEFIGGLLANSLALLADAAHMFSDAAALALSLFAIRFARRPADPAAHRADR